jgi:hypothetical protein
MRAAKAGLANRTRSAWWSDRDAGLPFKVASVAVLSLSLSACGIGRSDGGLFCSTGCSNPNEVRDSFCGCYPKSAQTPTSPGNTGNSLSFIADCMCDDHTGTYSAWFFDSLTAKDWTLNKKIKVSSTHCAWLNVCPVQQTGDGGEQYSVVTGSTSLMVSQTGWDARFGGNYVRGTPVNDHAMLPGPRAIYGATYDGVSPAAATLASFANDRLAASIAPMTESLPVQFAPDLLAAEVSRVPLMSPMPPAPILEATFRPLAQSEIPVREGIVEVAQSSPLPCETLCDPQKPTPYCTSLTLGGPSKAAFLQLFKLAHDQGVALYPQDLVLGLFDVAKDPCDRSSTTISNGVIRNVGGGCLVTTTSNVGNLSISATLDVPTTLSGNITRGTDTETIDFPNPATAITLAFSDTSFQSGFGGKVARLTARRDRLIWQTDKRCIAVGLQ